MKHILTAALCILVLFALGSVAYSQEIQTGTVEVSATTPGYASLQKGNGERAVMIDVAFAKSFEVKPDIIISVNSIDIPKESSIRISAKAISISRDGFTIIVKTWEDSKINGVTVSWIAISQKK